MTTATGDELAPAAETPGTPIADAHVSALQPLSTGYRRYALWMLLIIYTLNFLDRSIVNILAEPIKDELGLSDTQLGMMSGFAFAVFYTVLGIPIARLAERSNRPRIIGVSVAAWSAFTVLSGYATNFWQLLLARIGVGVGEAGCSPPAHSLIIDYVPREKRASAIAFYSIGTPLGSLLGLLLGGLIAEAYGWRAAFLVAGAPGVIVALITIFTLPEPRKRLSAELRAKSAEGPSLSAALRILRSKRTFWLIAGAAAIKALIGYGHAPFTASFFFRTHGPELASLGAQLSNVINGLFGTSISLGALGFYSIALSVISGTAGGIGTFLGGWISDKYAQKDLRAYVVIPAILSLIAIPLYFGALTTGDVPVAIFLLTIVALLGSFWYGPVYATAQSIVDPRMRATTAAILLFVINLVGLGLGPVAVGALSDFLNLGAGLGEGEGLRWALIATEVLNVLAFVFFWLARKTIREETIS